MRTPHRGEWTGRDDRHQPRCLGPVAVRNGQRPPPHPHLRPAGRRSNRTTPSGGTSQWTYDAAGSSTQLVTAGHTLRFEHDRAGQETTRHIGSATRLAHTYDDLGRVTTQTLTTHGHPHAQRRYTYRPDGHLTEVADLRGTRHYGLDPEGRPRTVRSRKGTEHYAYDSDGNQTHASWPAPYAGQDATGPRTYEGTRLLQAGNIRYEHDGQGRVVLRQKTRLSRKPDTWRYEWDAEDRLTAVTTPDGSRWTYLYDPLGRRIAKQRHSPDGTQLLEHTDFTWDGTTLCEQTTLSTDLPHPVTLTWDHQGLRPVAQTERITTADTRQEVVDQRFFAIVTDLIGTPTELVDETGQIAWYSQAPLWGATMWNTTATAYTPLRFPGQYYDPETGLHHNFFRHYDPETARYLTSDPLGLAAGPNPHAYVHNPSTWCDPLGLTPCEDAAKQAAARNESVLGPNIPTRAEASVGSTASHSYKKTFFAAHPHLKGKVVVHHAIEQQTLSKYPGLFSADEIHSLENLRGIPKGDINSKVHLSQIRVEWNKFYNSHPNPTRQEVLDHVTKVDDMLGNWFSPRTR
ncbi:RHS repeat domain-containing protein [Streptomyces sp. NPDC058001]|uniref:RHS repeat domain-containing protein n=1 Tax=Streptomyces sp. NPDC058001 TaxID=3346300 RepID=UPI0036E72B01